MHGADQRGISPRPRLRNSTLFFYYEERKPKLICFLSLLSTFHASSRRSSIIMSRNDDLAYGKYYESERGSGDGSRGLSDTFKKLKDTYKSHSKPSQGQGGDPNVSAVPQTSNDSTAHDGERTRTKIKAPTDTVTRLQLSRGNSTIPAPTQTSRPSKSGHKRRTNCPGSWESSKEQSPTSGPDWRPRLAQPSTPRPTLSMDQPSRRPSTALAVSHLLGNTTK